MPTKTRHPSLPPYVYGCGKDNVIRAYTWEEWGLGGSLPNGGNYQARTLTGMVIVTILMVPAALAAIVLTLIFAIGLHWAAIPAFFFAALFSVGVVSAYSSSMNEIRARKLRKAKGLPTPWQSVTDERARHWFEQHPELGIEITKENFPNADWA